MHDDRQGRILYGERDQPVRRRRLRRFEACQHDTRCATTYETYFNGRPHTVGPLSDPAPFPVALKGDLIDGSVVVSRGKRVGDSRGLERDTGEAGASSREMVDAVEVRTVGYCLW